MAYEWNKNARACYIMSRWWDQPAIANNYQLCQLKEGIIHATLDTKYILCSDRSDQTQITFILNTFPEKILADSIFQRKKFLAPTQNFRNLNMSYSIYP